ncbi:DUF4870 family protein [Psychrobacter sp. I-STPA6b]|uniref:DUF4870 family protein n=1 Tax=Psychrobacter sp. I-STPA6b TaxID=2585718 RepID=UPI001D0C2073|nr:hypothetical protein [Psychrobacter sp. I-STPA6b]
MAYDNIKQSSSTQSTFSQNAMSSLQSRTPVTLSQEEERRLVFYNHLTYLLYILSFFSAGLLIIVPIIMNYARRKEARYSWLASHFDWQIKTFWYSFIMSCFAITAFVVGVGTLGVSVFADSVEGVYGSMIFGVSGVLLIIFSCIWYLYRIVKGWIALNDGRPVL